MGFNPRIRISQTLRRGATLENSATRGGNLTTLQCPDSSGPCPETPDAKSVREKLGLSRNQFAALMGISPRIDPSWESNTRRQGTTEYTEDTENEGDEDMCSEFFDSDQKFLFVHLRHASIVVLISESRIRVYASRRLVISKVCSSHCFPVLWGSWFCLLLHSFAMMKCISVFRATLGIFWGLQFGAVAALENRLDSLGPLIRHNPYAEVPQFLVGTHGNPHLGLPSPEGNRVQRVSDGCWYLEIGNGIARMEPDYLSGEVRVKDIINAGGQWCVSSSGELMFSSRRTKSYQLVNVSLRPSQIFLLTKLRH